MCSRLVKRNVRRSIGPIAGRMALRAFVVLQVLVPAGCVSVQRNASVTRDGMASSVVAGGAPVAEYGVEAEDVGFGSVLCNLWIWIYQEYLSVVVSSPCMMYPSCSNYSKTACQKYGACGGIVLTVDRLLREGTDVRTGVVICLDGRSVCLDEVESNDFLWDRSQ